MLQGAPVGPIGRLKGAAAQSGAAMRDVFRGGGAHRDGSTYRRYLWGAIGDVYGAQRVVRMGIVEQSGGAHIPVPYPPM